MRRRTENIQTVPIAVTALTQQQLTDRQIAAGPDLITRRAEYDISARRISRATSIELRGIGTQAISVTTDPAVAVAFNGIPFIRNHFFEQEFFDVDNIEVLRGPQGTLYGRNATAGGNPYIPAKPTVISIEAMLSAGIGNYEQPPLRGYDQSAHRGRHSSTSARGRRVDQAPGLHIRSDHRIRHVGTAETCGPGVTIGLQAHLGHPDLPRLGAFLRRRRPHAQRQAALQDGADPGEPSAANRFPRSASDGEDDYVFDPATYFSQGCEMTSLYSPDAFEVPNGFSAQYVKAAKFSGTIDPLIDPYASTTQSTNLRVIESRAGAALQGQERHARTQCRLENRSGTNACYITDRLQP